MREEVSRAGAAALIGLPVWLIHWWWAQRLATGASAERASTLRRLYLYVVLAIALGAVASGVSEALSDALDGKWRDALPALPRAVVALVVWFMHWQIVTVDRAAVGEKDGSATLRRWYVYGASVVGLLAMLSGVRGILESIWTALAGSSAVGLTEGVPDAVVGLAIWFVHGVLLTTRFAEADRQSTLRSVAAFLSLAAVIGLTLYNLSQTLYYGLARLFGVDRPGGVGGSIWLAAASPVSGVLVYGTAWFAAPAPRGDGRSGNAAPDRHASAVHVPGRAVLRSGPGSRHWRPTVGARRPVHPVRLVRPARTGGGTRWRCSSRRPWSDCRSGCGTGSRPSRSPTTRRGRCRDGCTCTWC